MNSYNRHKTFKGNRLLTLITFLLAAAVVAAVVILYRKAPYGKIEQSRTVMQKTSQASKESSSQALTASSSQESSSQPQSSETKKLSGTVFIGDSFTQSLVNFEKPQNSTTLCSDNMTAFSAVGKTYDFGSGKQTAADAAASKNPEKIFILLGSNDVANGYSADKFAGYYGQLVSSLKSKIPGVKIYVQSIFPVTENYESKKHSGSSLTNNKIDSFNKALQIMCKSGGETYVDVSSALKGEDGKLPDSGSSDGLHLTKSYYQKWFDCIKNI